MGADHRSRRADADESADRRRGWLAVRFPGTEPLRCGARGHGSGRTSRAARSPPGGGCGCQGVNYFDVAPAYGDGEAEEKLGRILPAGRDGFFLREDLQRSAAGARLELERSLRRLGSDRFDLYQFHAVNTTEDIEKIFAPEGAMAAFLGRGRRTGPVHRILFALCARVAGHVGPLPL